MQCQLPSKFVYKDAGKIAWNRLFPEVSYRGTKDKLHFEYSRAQRFVVDQLLSLGKVYCFKSKYVSYVFKNGWFLLIPFLLGSYISV